jgi:multicomponent K+:H+ antiporter subunit C
MELLMASGIGVLTAAGVYLLLRPRSFETVIGLTLLSYAVNLFLFSMGRLVSGRAPIVDPYAEAQLAAAAGATNGYADPLPQALVLTAIVISFGMTALLLVLSLRAHGESRTDDVDGGELTGAGAGTGESSGGAFPADDQGDDRGNFHGNPDGDDRVTSPGAKR